jgi:hypothetical protein
LLGGRFVRLVAVIGGAPLADLSGIAIARNGEDKSEERGHEGPRHDSSGRKLARADDFVIGPCFFVTLSAESGLFT